MLPSWDRTEKQDSERFEGVCKTGKQIAGLLEDLDVLSREFCHCGG